ncbi:hypothetical protein HOLleu_08085 [Holothuria leucospilota]|uniref:Uncharacterized protein n=1 Tax=Holothuria leucospilota TaxID=206669 RepID=A0A9Q1CI39_HOLLE|nr:hypothetical protein HOLleu_08085 [Holothuria leucospilota]
MESAFQNSAVTVHSCAALDERQGGESLGRMVDIHNDAESNSLPYQILPGIKSPRPDSCKDRQRALIKKRANVDQHQSKCATTKTPMKIPISTVNIKGTASGDNKEMYTRSHASRKKGAKSPSNNIQCISQVINGVKCITFTTPDDTSRKRTADRDDGATKTAKRKLDFPDGCDLVTNRDANQQIDGKNGFLCQGIEKASTRADRIVTSLQWDVVKVLREATMIKGKDIVLVKPRGLSWAPSLSALRDKDGTLTVLSDSNMAALFQIEDQLNIALSSPDIAILNVTNLDRGTKSTLPSNVYQKELISNTDVEESTLGPPDSRQSKKDTTLEDSCGPMKELTDEFDMCKENNLDHEHSSLAAKIGFGEGKQLTDVSTGKVLPELQAPMKRSDADDEVRVMRAAIQLLSEIDISADQCIDLNAIDHAFEEADKNLQFIDESKLKRHSHDIDEAVAGLHTDWNQISEKLLRDLESIERRLSLAVAEGQNPKECENVAEIKDQVGSQSSINMEVFEDLSFEDDEAYSSLSPEQQQKYLDMLMKEPSILTPYDELIFELIDNNL